MKVLRDLSTIKEYDFPNLVLALGAFDGIHIGHQQVIAKAVAKARKIKGVAGVLTFSNHPLAVVRPEYSPKLINDEITKYRKIADLGVDVLMDIPFDKEMADKTPQEFMAMLRDIFKVKWVITGPNFTFGAKGKGTVKTLAKEGPKYGFKSIVQHFIYSYNDMVSSTVIRKAILEGDLPKVNRLLGQPFSISEEVIHGKKRGRELGFPTANLDIQEKRAMLPNGVYIVYAYVRGVRYHGVASIGTNPTFEDISRRVEVYIFDFDEFIYGEVIRVDFLVKIRNEVRFKSVESLICQMEKDIGKAKRYFAEHKDA